jgi:hypothetical protein
MKKVGFLLLIAVLSFSVLIGCTGGESAPSGTASEIADKMFAQSGVEKFGMSDSIQDDSKKEFYLGSKDYPAFADSVVVLPMINIDTRVLAIIKAADKGDAGEIKTELEENIDPNRVVCVTFTLEDVTIESRGEVIFLSINTDADQRKALLDAFEEID